MPNRELLTIAGERLIGLFAALLTVGLTFACMPARAQDVMKLNIVGGFPTSRTFTHYMKPFWEKRVPEVTKGAITADVVSYTDIGVKGGEVVRMMSAGTLQGGLAMLGYVAGDDPIVEGVDLPGLTLDSKTTKQAVEAFRPVLNDVYRKKYGIVPLAFFPGPMQVFYCSAPIKGLADFQGRKIRVWSAGMGDFVAAAGGIPVTMPMGEVVSSLQRKVVDCAVTGTMAGNQAKWFEVTSHYYPLAMGWSIWLLGVNEATWEKIKPELRDVLQKEIAVLENDVWKDSSEETLQGSLCNTGSPECKIGNKGAMTLVEISSADLALQKKIMEETVLPKWSKACGNWCAERWNSTVGRSLGMAIKP